MRPSPRAPSAPAAARWGGGGRFQGAPADAAAPCQQPTDCDDGDMCTSDPCTAGACEHAPITCDDGDMCTTDTCSPTSGCVSAALTCNDNNACTTDTCSPATGCKFTQPGGT